MVEKLRRAELDSARFDWREVEPMGARDLRAAQVFLIGTTGVLVWRPPLIFPEPIRITERLQAWRRPRVLDLATLVERLSPAQLRTVRDLPEHHTKHLMPDHMHNDQTTRVLMRRGLSDGHRLTDLGLLVHHYLHMEP